MISLFSFTPPAGDQISDVTISPPSGLYSSTLQLQFTAANPSDSIFFRVGAGAWRTWSSGMIVNLFTNASVQYYGQPAGPGNAKSSIRSASYSFTVGPSTLDSKGDGIPDYVKIALGLSLTGSADTDGDGYTDLEELIHGTNPLDPNNAPTNYPHLDDQAAFNLFTQPLPWDGFSNAPTLGSTGTVLRVYDFEGSLLSFGPIASNTYPAATLSNITIVAEDRLVTYGTDKHYFILTTNSDTKVGTEMLGLVAVPPLVFPTIDYVYGGGNITNEALNWVAAASNAYANLPRATFTNTLSVANTVESLLFEQRVAGMLGARGTNWWTNMTLFPYRISDSGRINPDQPTLLSLELATTNQPGFLLQTTFATISNLVSNSGSPGVASLLQVVEDIYRIDSTQNNTNPAKFASPVDETRYFLWNGTMDSNYLAWATTAGQFNTASNGAAAILAAVSTRPTTNVTLIVRADTQTAPCRILDLSGGGPTFALLDTGGLPFLFPQNFQLLPGSSVRVTGYTDVSSPTCSSYPAIEVTSIVLASVPIVTGTDSNGNLLYDDWEYRFFGGLGVADPFGDTDGDGYSNLQEMLDGTDPRDPYSVPAGPPANFQPPVLSLDENSGQVELSFSWPAAYINRFNFGVEHTADLAQPFEALAVSAPVNVSGNEFMITFTLPNTIEHFYYLTVALH
jgi:hypothetical protein